MIRPAGGGVVTSQFDYNYFDGGGTHVTLPKQHNVLFELGNLFPGLKLTPVQLFYF